MPPSQEKFEATISFCVYLSKINNTEKLKKGIDDIFDFKNGVSEANRSVTDPVITSFLTQLGKLKGPEIANYIKDAMQ